jgi:hypothetical protein
MARQCLKPLTERSPADATGLTVHIGKIAPGGIEDEQENSSSSAAEMGRKGGKACAQV